MATYNYECREHELTVSVQIRRSITAEEVTPDCYKCGKQMIRIFDAPPTMFIGSGFYSTDK